MEQSARFRNLTTPNPASFFHSPGQQFDDDQYCDEIINAAMLESASGFTVTQRNRVRYQQLARERNAGELRNTKD
jgi:hypothetical protein